MIKSKSTPAVKHYIIEIFGLDSKILEHTHLIKNYVNKLIKALDLKVLGKLVYDFKPFGATYLFVLSGSHLTIHTWPENDYLHIDLFVCNTAKPKKNLSQVVKGIFETNNFRIRQIPY